jgi:quinol-cytochrome oxidoreductase complex cytochrome b subunit
MAVTEQTGGTGSRIGDFFEERLRIRPLLAALLHVRIPIEARPYYLGGITLFLFAVQVVTGTLLSLYYQPTPEAAYDSVKYITSSVEFGWLIRSVHHWGANLMIICVVLHLLRVFLHGAYKYPRELTWILGAGLLALTIGFGFTGYLLPWDQRAFWATTVGTEIAGGVPVIGEALLALLRGGAEVTAATLSRFFGMHVLVLPLGLGALLLAHLTIVHQLGLANPKRAEPRARASETVAPAAPERLKPFFPDYVLDEAIAWAFMLAILVVLASIFPAGLEAKADPLATPAHVKPEWYFLAVYQLLKIVPRTLGIMAPIVAVGALAFLPFLDRNPAVTARKRPIAIVVALIAIATMVVLTIWGQYS